MEDCYYFLQGSCARGSSCRYRHSEEAKNSHTMCPDWRGSKCQDDNCPLLHTHHEIKERKDIECYWQTRGGCKKTVCPFKHSKSTTNSVAEEPAQMNPQAKPFVPHALPNTGNMATIPSKTRSRSPIRRSVPVKGVAAATKSTTAGNTVNATPAPGIKELDFEIKSFDEIMREKRKKLNKDQLSHEASNPSPQVIVKEQNNIHSNAKWNIADTPAAVTKSDDFDDIDKTIAELDELMNS